VLGKNVGVNVGRWVGAVVEMLRSQTCNRQTLNSLTSPASWRRACPCTIWTTFDYSRSREYVANITVESCFPIHFSNLWILVIQVPILRYHGPIAILIYCCSNCNHDERGWQPHLFERRRQNQPARLCFGALLHAFSVRGAVLV
jgi:hypothetical protein